MQYWLKKEFAENLLVTAKKKQKKNGNPLHHYFLRDKS